MPKPLSTPLPRKTAIQAVHTRKANNHAAAKQSKASALSVVDKRLAALELRLRNYSIVDIAAAIGVSPGRVSQLIAEVLYEKQKATVEAVSALRALELLRVDQMIRAWFKKAKRDAKASTILLAWLTRRHRLLGLDSPIVERSGRDRPNENAESTLCLARLNDEELGLLENIIAKASVEPPPLG